MCEFSVTDLTIETVRHLICGMLPAYQHGNSYLNPYLVILGWKTLILIIAYAGINGTKSVKMQPAGQPDKHLNIQISSASAKCNPLTMKSSIPSNDTSSKPSDKSSDNPTDKPRAKTVEIDSEHSGQRIDNYLMGQLKGVPRSHIYQLLRSGQVRVNSGRIKPHYKLKSGDTVRIPPVNTTSRDTPIIPDSVQKLLSDAILFENADILVLNKPSGLAVHSGSGLSFGIIEALKAQQPDQFLELAHRLDRETSGCLLLAKNRVTLTHLHDLLRNEKETGLGKFYLTLVAGRWQKATTIDIPLKKVIRSGEHMVEVVEDGQTAISHFEPLQLYKNATLMRVKIDTGRTHQIRVHAAHAGHPIAGDAKYGDTAFNRELKKIGLNRLFLHAARLEIPALESTSDAPIVIDAPLNSELRSILDKLQT